MGLIHIRNIKFSTSAFINLQINYQIIKIEIGIEVSDLYHLIRKNFHRTNLKEKKELFFLDIIKLTPENCMDYFNKINIL